MHTCTERNSMEASDTKDSIGDDTPSLTRPELRERSQHLLAAPNILDQIGSAARSHGFVGPLRNLLIVYLAVMTRLFAKRVVSVVLMGPPSAGKSETIKAAIRLHPAEAYLELTAMSDKALYYTSESFANRMIVVYETAGLSGDFLTYGLRSLLSEGRLRYEVTVIERQDTVRIEKEGPTGLISSTAGSTERQLATRVLSLTVPDDVELTRQVMLAAARDQPEGVDLDPFHSLQRYIATGPTSVSVPFAEQLAMETDDRAVRMRRDFAAVLALTRAHALLHQESRERDAKGSVIATRQDYAGVYHLIAMTIAEGIEASVPPSVRNVVKAVADASYKTYGPNSPATLLEIADKLDRGRSTASRSANRAVSLGYLVEVGDGRRRLYELGDPMPEDRGVLPPPEIID